MKTYKATIKINGRQVQVQVQANGQIDAKALLESQHGKGSIFFGPDEVR